MITVRRIYMYVYGLYYRIILSMNLSIGLYDIQFIYTMPNC